MAELVAVPLNRPAVKLWCLELAPLAIWRTSTIFQPPKSSASVRIHFNYNVFVRGEDIMINVLHHGYASVFASIAKESEERLGVLCWWPVPPQVSKHHIRIVFSVTSMCSAAVRNFRRGSDRQEASLPSNHKQFCSQST